MDFRTHAAETTVRRTGDSSGAALAQLNESGCLEIPGGRTFHRLIEIPFLIFTTGSFLAIMIVILLRTLNILSLKQSFVLSTILLVIGLVCRKIKSFGLNVLLRRRTGSLLLELAELPSFSVGLEEGATHKQLKMLPEDQGQCILDASRRRILIEGYSYRYVIFARDVISIQPIARYAMSGARLNCQMAGSTFDVVLTEYGQGPIASIIQLFSPVTGAVSLAARLNQTFFGVDATSYLKPPPLPSGVH